MKEVKLQKSQLDVYFRPSFVGTPEYVSPEMLENSKASKEADLWAVGCIIYEVFILWKFIQVLLRETTF